MHVKVVFSKEINQKELNKTNYITDILKQLFQQILMTYVRRLQVQNELQVYLYIYMYDHSTHVAYSYPLEKE